MTDDDAQIVTDPPVPSQPELEQRDIESLQAVPVNVVGPVLVQSQPARIGWSTVEFLSTTPTRVLSADMKRASALLVCASAWKYRSSQRGLAVTIPANVILPIEHAGEVWAASASGTEVELGIIGETYAQ